MPTALSNSDTKFLVDFIVSSEHIMYPLSGGGADGGGGMSSPSTSSVLGGGVGSASHSRTSSMHSMGSALMMQQQHSRTGSYVVAASNANTVDSEAAGATSSLCHPEGEGGLSTVVPTTPEALSHFPTQLLERHHHLNTQRPVARVLTRCPGNIVNQFISLIENHFVAPLIHAATAEGQASLRRQQEETQLQTNKSRSNSNKKMKQSTSSSALLLPTPSPPIVLQYDLSEEGKGEGDSIHDNNISVVDDNTTAGGAFDVIPVENLEVFAVLYTLEDCIAYLCSHLLHGTATKSHTHHHRHHHIITSSSAQHDGDAYQALDPEGYTVYGGVVDGATSTMSSSTKLEDDNAIMSEVWHTCGTWLLDLADAYYHLVVMNDNNQQQDATKRTSTSIVEMSGNDNGLSQCREVYLLSGVWSPIGCYIRSLDYATKSSLTHQTAIPRSAMVMQGVTPSEVWGRLADTLELYERQMYRLYRTGHAKSVDIAAQLLHLPVADGVRIAGCTMEGPLSTFENDAESQDAERRFEQGGKGVVGVVMRSSFFTALECRISAVRVHPTNAVALNNLGVQLALPPAPYNRGDDDGGGMDGDDSDDDTNLNGMPSVIRIDRNAPGAVGSSNPNATTGARSHHHLVPGASTDLQSLDTMSMEDDAAASSPLRSYTKQQCYLRAIGSDPTFGLPWKNLADTILVPKSVVTIEDEQECGVLIGERLYCREDCVVECLVRDPTNADAWNHLGCLLAEREIRRAATSSSSTNTKASLVVPTTSVSDESQQQQPSNEPTSEIAGADADYESTPTREEPSSVAPQPSTMAPLKSKSYLGREGTQESILRQVGTSSGHRRRVLDDQDIDSPALAIVSDAAVTKVHCFIRSLELVEDSTGDVWNNLGAALQDKYLVGDGGKGKKGGSNNKDQPKKSKKSSTKNKKCKPTDSVAITTNGPDQHVDDEEENDGDGNTTDKSYYSGYTSNTIAAVQLVLSGDVERIGENAGGNSVLSVGGGNGTTMANGTQGVKQTVPSVVRVNGEWYSKEDCLNKALALGCDGADENIQEMLDVRQDVEERCGKTSGKKSGGCQIQ